MRAADIMSREPWTLSPSATIADAVQVMREHQIHHVPITSHGRLVGIVSDRDLFGLFPEPANDDDLPLRLASFQRPVSAVAHTEVVAVNPDTELHVVIDLLLGRHVGAVPVIERDGHRLVGLVSATDVLRSVRALV